MGFDGKYGKVITEFGDIPGDEPVIVFRGRDRLLPDLLDEYARQCGYHAAPHRHVELVRDAAERIRRWQEDHPQLLRTPSSEGYFERVDAGRQDPMPGSSEFGGSVTQNSDTPDS